MNFIRLIAQIFGVEDSLVSQLSTTPEYRTLLSKLEQLGVNANDVESDIASLRSELGSTSPFSAFKDSLRKAVKSKQTELKENRNLQNLANQVTSGLPKGVYDEKKFRSTTETVTNRIDDHLNKYNPENDKGDN